MLGCDATITVKSISVVVVVERRSRGGVKYCVLLNANWFETGSKQFEIIGVARGVGNPAPPLIEMLSMIKMSQKRRSFFQFLLASSCTTVHAWWYNTTKFSVVPPGYNTTKINNNIFPGGLGPPI